MINEKIEKIEQIISSSEVINSKNKEELLSLVIDLKKELNSLKDLSQEDSENIVQFAETSALVAAKKNQKVNLIDISLNGLNSSVEGFEASHPELTKTVNSIAEMLSNIGI